MNKQLREPHYSCENDYCAEECTYPVYMLKEHEGKLWCNSCWREDDPTVIDGESEIDWGDLDNFVPDQILGWISHTSRLPASESLVLVCNSATGTVIPCIFYDGYWLRIDGTEIQTPTHWMHIPPAAKSGDV